jgi:hypothetical protein
MRSAAGGFARFAKRFGVSEEEDKSGFMWIIVVLVFILVGVGIALCTRRQAARPPPPPPYFSGGGGGGGSYDTASYTLPF